jgi:hypothetical protein
MLQRTGGIRDRKTAQVIDADQYVNIGSKAPMIFFEQKNSFRREDIEFPQFSRGGHRSDARQIELIRPARDQIISF